MTHLKFSTHGEARNIKSGQQVNIEKATLGTPPQEVVMSLAHNHVTISLSEVTEGLLLSELLADRVLLTWDSNVITV